MGLNKRLRIDTSFILGLVFCFIFIQNGLSQTDNPDDEYGVSSIFSFNKSIFGEGDSLIASLTIMNISTTVALEDVQVIFNIPLNLDTQKDTFSIGVLQPQQKVVVKCILKPSCGSGNTILSAEIWSVNDCLSFETKSVFISGKGWYSGDNHTHSLYSDGYGAIQDNVDAAIFKGMSFLTCTDHNTVNQTAAVARANSNRFIAVVGSEVTPISSGHAIALFCKKVIPFTPIRSQKDAQKVIDNVNAADKGRSMVIIAHPFMTNYEWKWNNVLNMKGFEVWNGFSKPRSTANIRAFELWDSKLKAGYQYFGFAGSDGHSPEIIGSPRICAYLSDFNVDALNEGISRGNFFGTNGPDLRFNVDSVPMGGRLSVPTKKSVKINFEAFSSFGLDTILILKNGTLLKKIIYSGCENRVITNIMDEATAGDYYRMEVVDNLKRFAFSNPVFIVSGTPTAPNTTDTIVASLDGVLEKDVITLYPNPASDFVYLKSSQAGPLSLAIFDSSGKKWIQERVEGNTENRIDLTKMPKGIYYIRINEAFKKLIVK